MQLYVAYTIGILILVNQTVCDETNDATVVEQLRPKQNKVIPIPEMTVGIIC